jgi:hypothetical protein
MKLPHIHREPSLNVSKREQYVKTIYIICKIGGLNTYDHRSVRTGHPVRSAIHKH